MRILFPGIVLFSIRKELLRGEKTGFRRAGLSLCCPVRNVSKGFLSLVYGNACSVYFTYIYEIKFCTETLLVEIFYFYLLQILFIILIKRKVVQQSKKIPFDPAFVPSLRRSKLKNSKRRLRTLSALVALSLWRAQKS